MVHISLDKKKCLRVRGSRYIVPLRGRFSNAVSVVGACICLTSTDPRTNFALSMGTPFRPADILLVPYPEKLQIGGEFHDDRMNEMQQIKEDGTGGSKGGEVGEGCPKIGFRGVCLCRAGGFRDFEQKVGHWKWPGSSGMAKQPEKWTNPLIFTTTYVTLCGFV